MLIDMHLPDMTGHDVMRAFLDDADLCRVPCVAFSAEAGAQAVDDAIRCGFRGFLP